MGIDSLPIEILGRITSSLPPSCLYACCLTNKRFYTTSVPLLWRDIMLKSLLTWEKLCMSLANVRTPLGHHVRQVHIYCDFNDDDCIRLMKHMPNLEVLELVHAGDLTDRSIVPLVQTCLQLEDIHLHSSSITYRSLHYFSGLKRLRKLDLSGCGGLSPFALLPLQNCPLELLNLSLCRWLNAKDTALDLKGLSLLKELNLICCSTVGKEFMQYLLPSTDNEPVPLPRLHTFSLTGDDAEIDDYVIIPFVKSHPHLRSLILMDCAITDRSLIAIRDYLPKLLDIEISYCNHVSSSGVRQLVLGIPRLEMIGVKNCDIPKKDFPEVWKTDVDQTDSRFVDRLTFREIEQIRAGNVSDTPAEIHELELALTDTSPRSDFLLI
ncbi:hypothetical protein EC973_005703 [Apophysomyces ossiformis]|uniref:F-box domain-containing protein n=1 Tax=Apophysomyces ossiformis TaxID=679940 RepID=A0A8H7BRU4_9FUNG|nr:hypothetical protein EC973_005703 [Apophysomyces ossiformis]